MTDQPIIHLAKDINQTFCGKAFSHLMHLSTSVEAATCDACVKACLASPDDPIDLRQTSRRGEAISLGEIFREMFGGQYAEGAGALVLGDRAFDTYAIERIIWNDTPETYTRMLEVPAYAASVNDVFPHPATVVLSCLSFYNDIIHGVLQNGAISPEAASERIQAAIDLHKAIESSRIQARSVHDWPLTAELWKPKDEGK